MHVQKKDRLVPVMHSFMAYLDPKLMRLADPVFQTPFGKSRPTAE
jgi:hypothetical protein